MQFADRDIYVYGNPKWSILGFRSDTLNPHLIADEMDKRGWKLSLLQNPPGFHLCLTHVHTLADNFEDKFITDLTAAIAAVKKYPADKKPDGNVKVYGAIGMMPTQVQKDVCHQYQKARLSYEGKLSRASMFSSAEELTDDNLNAFTVENPRLSGGNEPVAL